MIRAAVAALALTSLWAWPHPAAARKLAREQTDDGGVHWRLETENGPVHVYRPPGYRHGSAGVVVYLHGLYVTADKAWAEHDLATQFAASRQNALFVVPEAPLGEEVPPWGWLEDLLDTVAEALRTRLPRGPLVVLGHSGSFRQVVMWLDHPALANIILLDALYGNEDDFRAWLDASPRHRMTIVANDSRRWADPFVAAIRHAVTRDELPEGYDDFTDRERRARVLYMRTETDHMELVTLGIVVPMLLRRTPLRAL